MVNFNDHIVVPGLDPEMPTVTNEKGGKQSDTPYALNLIPPLAILAESKVLKNGKDKYGAWNWTNISIEDHLNHALQHIYAYLAGDRSDNHLANLSCRSHFALELQEREKQKGVVEELPLPDIKLKVNSCSICGKFVSLDDYSNKFINKKVVCEECFKIAEKPL